MNKLKNLNLAEDAPVKLKCDGAAQVAHYTGDYIDEAIEETAIVDQLAYVASYEDIRKYNSVLNEMRQRSLLDDYERGAHNFFPYVKNVIYDNWFDYIDERLEQWDSKRGLCKMSAEIEVPLNLLLEAGDNGLHLGEMWTAFVETTDGILEVNCV